MQHDRHTREYLEHNCVCAILSNRNSRVKAEHFTSWTKLRRNTQNTHTHTHTFTNQLSSLSVKSLIYSHLLLNLPGECMISHSTGVLRTDDVTLWQNWVNVSLIDQSLISTAGVLEAVSGTWDVQAKPWAFLEALLFFLAHIWAFLRFPKSLPKAFFFACSADRGKGYQKKTGPTLYPNQRGDKAWVRSLLLGLGQRFLRPSHQLVVVNDEAPIVCFF